MPIAKLSIDLEARLGRLEQDMGRATRVMEQSAGKMSSAFSAAGAGIKGVLSGALGALSVGAITSAFAAIVRGIDNLNDLADATGASVENLSALEDVAARTGTRMETVGTALTKFNAQITEGLRPGTEAARVFELIGLNAKELADIDPAEALVRTAKALATFADDGNKARVVYALFGKSVGEVAPLLKDLAENGKLNATVTTEQAKEAEKFRNELNSLEKSLTDVARQMSGPVIKAANQFIEKMREAQKEGRGFLSVMLRTQLEFLGLGGRGGGATADFEDTSNYSNEGRRPRRSVGNIPDKPSAGRSGKVDIPFAITNAAESYKSAFLKAEKDYEATNKLLDQIQAKADETARRLKESIGEEGRRVFEETRSPAERLAAEIDRLNKLLEAGAIDWDTYARAQIMAQENFDKTIKESIKATRSIAEELGLAFESAFENAIIGGRGLRDVLKGIEQDITRIIIRKLVTEPAAEWLTGAIKGMTSGGGGGGFMASIGSWFSSLFSGGFAEGGYIPPGRWGMAGERGPEPVFGGRTGATVRPYSGAVTINISVPGNTDGRTAQQVAVAAARAVSAAQRRGG